MKDILNFVCIALVLILVVSCFKDEAGVSHGDVFEIDMDSFGLISFDRSTGEVFIPVKTNMGQGWSVESSDEWCHVERVSKSVHGISVTVDENKSGDSARSSRIVARGGSEEYMITVIQK
ncbi:MAG: BACON domain-containing protein [Bacteroidales bacterium]|nr:BACON domain-containing protein [Bacteroidales bacterium]